MKEAEDISNKQDTRRVSGATRRIVVEDLPDENPPRAQGRRLIDPLADRSQGAKRIAESGALGGYPATQGPTGLGLNDRRRTVVQRNETPRLGTDRKHLQSSSRQVSKSFLIIIGVVMLVFAGLVVAVMIKAGTERQVRITSTEEPSVSAPVSRVEPSNAPPAVSGPANVKESPQPAKEAEPAFMAATEIRSLSEQLAAQISQKTGYAFAPEFVELIRVHTQDYVNPKAFGAAKSYRREINKAFRDEAINPLVGYALAMSRSNFDPKLNERGIGLWQIPPQVVRSQGYLSPRESYSKLGNPEIAAQMSARYTKDLLSIFDTEDFMYAVACFGMSLQDVGAVQARLVTAAPNPKSRRDIMNVIKAGNVLNADQVDGLARFFAAGIVGENPQKFGLQDVQPFSALW